MADQSIFGKLLGYLALPFSQSETQSPADETAMQAPAMQAPADDHEARTPRRQAIGPTDDDPTSYITISKEEFLSPIKDEYLLKISKMSADELYDGYNPGPINPDGSVNFECHCVSHLVASPCGYAFRDAVTCQRSAPEEELDKGACADEFIEFMDCVTRTKCFRPRSDKEKSIDDEDVLKVPATAPTPPDK